MRLSVIFILFLTIVSCSSVGKMPDKAQDQMELVYLLHGLGRNNNSMWYLNSKFKSAGYMVKRVGYPSINRSPKEILKIVSDQIDSNIYKSYRKVHFVGHSLGGLMIRAYLDKNRVENLGRVILIGTPNHGTQIVDRYKKRWYLKILGEMTLSLGTDDKSFPNSIPAPYYPVGVIAGVTERLYNEFVLPGKDDGVVTVESTKLIGMKDLIVIRTNHTMMRYDRDVGIQSIEFLREGRFKSSKSRAYKIFNYENLK